MNLTNLNKEDMEKWVKDMEEHANIVLTTALKRIDYDQVEVIENVWIDPEYHEDTPLDEVNDELFTTLVHSIHSILKDYRDKADMNFNDLLDSIKKQVIMLQEFEEPNYE